MPTLTASHGSAGHGASRWVAKVSVIWAGAMFGLAILLGGSSANGLRADLLLQLMSLPLMVLALVELADTDDFRRFRYPMLIVASAYLLLLLQLVPLPPFVWSHLPGGGMVADMFDATGIEMAWRPLSLSPHATLYALFSMLPATAIFLATLSFDTRDRYVLLIAPMALGVASVLLGLAQLLSPDPDALNVVHTPHRGYAIGFFTNRNHFAALLYSLLPLTVAWMLGYANTRKRGRPIALLSGAAVIVVLLVGMSVAFSRAGVVLSVASVCGALVLVWRSQRTIEINKWIVIGAGGALLAAAILLQLGLIDLLLQRSASDSLRTTIVATTLTAMTRFGWLGSGFGTFVPIYMQFEVPSDLIAAYVNHAHNELLEILLEGGIPAAAILVAFFVWFARRLRDAWRATEEDTDGSVLLERAASISVVLLLLHSLVDYPLRTTALMTLFGYCCALMVAPAKRHHHRVRRHA